MENIAHKIFTYDKFRVFFKHTNFYGVIHPYNFFEWTSYTREAFFSELVASFRSILDSPVKMMTAKINLEMLSDSSFGDLIEARLNVTKIKKVSFDVIVRFYNSTQRRMVCETRHTLVFVDSTSERFTSIPQGILEKIIEYEEAEA